MNEELKRELGFNDKEKIPGDYHIPFFVHENDMNMLDMSHKRVERSLISLIIGLLVIVGIKSYVFMQRLKKGEIIDAIKGN